MNVLLFDNVIQSPVDYVKDILDNDFEDIYDGVNVYISAIFESLTLSKMIVKYQHHLHPLMPT